MKNPLSAALAVLMLSLPLTAGAQGGVWRCGAEGRSYSDQPCTDGRPVALTDARPAADIDSAHAQARQEQALAQRLRRERLTQEARMRGNGLASLGPQTGAVKPEKSDRHQAKDRLVQPRQPETEAAGTWRAIAQPTRRAKG